LLVALVAFFSVLCLGLSFQIGNVREEVVSFKQDGVEYVSLSSLGKALSELSTRLGVDFEVGTFGPMYFLRYGDVVASFMVNKSILSGPGFVKYLPGPVIEKDGEIFLPIHDILDVLGLTYKVVGDTVIFVTCVIERLRLEDGLIELEYKGEPLFNVQVEGRFVEVELTGPSIFADKALLPKEVSVEGGYDNPQRITVELANPVSDFSVERSAQTYRIEYSVKVPSFTKVVLKMSEDDTAVKNVFENVLERFGIALVAKPTNAEDEVEIALIKSRHPSILYEPEAKEHEGYFHRQAVLSKRLAEKLASELSWTYEPIYLTLLDPAVVAVALAWPFDDLERIAEAVGKCLVEF